ncbi:MAG: hypothetical protein MUC96_23555 [Myxococcaceae bacterium]|jgi:hypothetical protein|nr:hypothetical protein [Myxococcaceae bacterium]
MASEPSGVTPPKPRSVADAVAASRERARGLAGQLPHVPGDVSELLRADAVAFCARAPEPPVYRRRDDPTKAQAQGLIGEAEGLLARALHSNDQPWVVALEAWLVTLHQLAQGQVEAAEVSWAEAQRLERLATGRRRLFALSDERPPPVFDPSTRQSRYDPRAEKSVQVKLPCPSCRKVSEFSFSPRNAEHAYGCTHCAIEFSAYVAEVRSVEVARSGTRRRYVFRLTELSGLSTRLDVEDVSSAELQVARNDLLAFLYQPRSVLRGVLNLSSSRVLWVTSAGPCFVATVAFGEGAPELDVLRRFRDEALLPRRAGRLLVRAYYAAGPALARVVRAVPGARALTRRGLAFVVAGLERSGLGARAPMDRPSVSPSCSWSTVSLAGPLDLQPAPTVDGRGVEQARLPGVPAARHRPDERSWGAVTRPPAPAVALHSRVAPPVAERNHERSWGAVTRPPAPAVAPRSRVAPPVAERNHERSWGAVTRPSAPAAAPRSRVAPPVAERNRHERAEDPGPAPIRRVSRPTEPGPVPEASQHDVARPCLVTSRVEPPGQPHSREELAARPATPAATESSHDERSHHE